MKNIPANLSKQTQWCVQGIQESNWSCQRRRDDNKNNICVFEGGGPWGNLREKRPKRCFFFLGGKRHDNKILKADILLSKNFVLIAQAPIVAQSTQSSMFDLRVRSILVLNVSMRECILITVICFGMVP